VLSTVAAISGFYDFMLGAFLLLASDRLTVLFGVPPAHAQILRNLNELFR
jgi:hypothetical protein